MKYGKAPLPFQGQKTKFVKEVARLASQFESKYLGERITVLDLFGGSGLLSRSVKDVLPKARVIYNDFDGYVSRIEKIPRTNILLEALRDLWRDIPRDEAVPESLASEALGLIADEDLMYGVDYQTLASSVLFAGKRARTFEELAGHKMYNRIVINDYATAEDYLEGLEVVSMSYTELLKIDFEGRLLLILDPPYLNTNIDSYRMDQWGLVSHLNVLLEMQGRSFVYFTSSKSEIQELLLWLESNTDFRIHYSVEAKKTSSGVGVSYEDRMLYSI